VNSTTDSVILQTVENATIGEMELPYQTPGEPNPERVNTGLPNGSNNSPITIEEHYPASLNPQNKVFDSEQRPRRESLASLVGGMSWGGVSVGSWIRDE